MPGPSPEWPLAPRTPISRGGGGVSQAGWGPAQGPALGRARLHRAVQAAGQRQARADSSTDRAVSPTCPGTSAWHTCVHTCTCLVWTPVRATRPRASGLLPPQAEMLTDSGHCVQQTLTGSPGPVFTAPSSLAVPLWAQRPHPHPLQGAPSMQPPHSPSGLPWELGCELSSVRSLGEAWRREAARAVTQQAPACDWLRVQQAGGQRPAAPSRTVRDRQLLPQLRARCMRVCVSTCICKCCACAHVSSCVWSCGAPVSPRTFLCPCTGHWWLGTGHKRVDRAGGPQWLLDTSCPWPWCGCRLGDGGAQAGAWQWALPAGAAWTLCVMGPA